MPLIVNGRPLDPTSPRSLGGAGLTAAEVAASLDPRYVRKAGDTMTGPLVVASPSAPPLDLTGPTTLAGTQTAFTLRNAAGAPIMVWAKNAGTENVEIRFLGEPVAAPNLALGNVFAGFPSYFGYKNDFTDLSLGVLGDPTFYINFGSVFPPAGTPPDRVQVGSSGALGHPSTVTVLIDPLISLGFFPSEKGLHLVHNVDFSGRFVNLTPPDAASGPCRMRFGPLTRGLDIEDDLEVDGFGLGGTPTDPTALGATYTVASPTVDRSFDASSATLAELRNVVGTIIADLQAYGLFL
jgi:hypothetical protein